MRAYILQQSDMDLLETIIEQFKTQLKLGEPGEAQRTFDTKYENWKARVGKVGK